MAAISIIQGIGPQKYLKNLRNGLIFFSGISLYPYFTRRSFASEAESPFSVDASFRNRSFTETSFMSLMLITDYSHVANVNGFRPTAMHITLNFRVHLRWRTL